MSMSNHPRGTSYIINYSAMFCNGLSDIAGKKGRMRRAALKIALKPTGGWRAA